MLRSRPSPRHIESPIAIPTSTSEIASPLQPMSAMFPRVSVSSLAGRRIVRAEEELSDRR